ncbi:MAG TPA: AlkA N-terminal domain-containing protein [Verrucomicrobiae bacterium]|nr:AlkA N-terminal domain-containing protein [Verrucomicrobiae bacterium]
MHEATLTLPVKPPFRLDLTVWVLRRRAKNSIDTWDGNTYRRVFTIDGRPALAKVHQKTGDLVVKLKSSGTITYKRRTELEKLVRRTLGLDVNLEPFYKLTATDQTLESLTRQFVGVRPPRFPSIFETLVNAIACQQVSLNVGILLINRLADSFGKPIVDGEMTLHAFPEPQDIVVVDESSLKQLGFSYQKVRAISSLAYAIANNDVDLKALSAASNDQVMAVLQSLRGIGRWSAEYVLLRGLGRINVFPGDDIGGQNNLQRLLGLDMRPSYEELRRLTSKWNPYAGLIYFHLLLGKLREKELI